MPVWKIQSSGGGRWLKETTCRQTCSGGASISIAVVDDGEEEQVDRHRQEEADDEPEGQTGVAQAIERHGDADPDERQRDGGHREVERAISRIERGDAADDVGGLEVRERRPGAAEELSGDLPVDEELEQEKKEADDPEGSSA
jgi:hypothetical protein